MPHHCHAEGCELIVPPKLLMCANHWFMVPKPLRDAVWRTYRPGQERDKRPSPEYLAAAKAAIEAVAAVDKPRKKPAPPPPSPQTELPL